MGYTPDEEAKIKETFAAMGFTDRQGNPINGLPVDDMAKLISSITATREVMRIGQPTTSIVDPTSGDILITGTFPKI